MTERFDVKIMGRVIGTSSGYDIQDTMCISYYDFIPSDVLSEEIPTSSCFDVDVEAGDYSCYTEENPDVIYKTADLFKILAMVQRSAS